MCFPTLSAATITDIANRLLQKHAPETKELIAEHRYSGLLVTASNIEDPQEQLTGPDASIEYVLWTPKYCKRPSKHLAAVLQK